MTLNDIGDQIIKSSGNVYADLGLTEPAVEVAKAELAHAISRIIDARGWTQAEAARRMGIDQPKVSAITRGRLAGFSLERLIRLLDALDYTVDITVRPATHSAGAGASAR